jgi:hypothetical protein
MQSLPNPQANTPSGISQYQSQDTSVMTTGDWFVTQLILSIPLVNLIMLFVWGFSSTGNVNRSNFCKATLIWIAIAIGLYACIFLFIIGSNR